MLLLSSINYEDNENDMKIKKSKRFNKQNKNPERATHFLCGYHMTYFVKLDGNVMRVSL